MDGGTDDGMEVDWGRGQQQQQQQQMEVLLHPTLGQLLSGSPHQLLRVWVGRERLFWVYYRAENVVSR
jgi:hypothetical protein